MWEISVKIPLGFGVGVRMAYLMIEKNACKFSKVRAGNFWLKKNSCEMASTEAAKRKFSE